MDVDAATKKNERKGEKHETHREGSTSPLYFRRFLDEIRMVDSGTRDSFWGLNETLRVPETQYAIMETSTQVNVK